MTTVLLIPGLLCDRTVWEPLIDRLDGKAEVAEQTRRDNLTTTAQDILAGVQGDLAVAGHSMGARIALEMARLAPGRITRLALLDTGVHPLKEGERERRAEIVRYAFENGMEALAERWLPGMVHEPNWRDPNLRKNLTEMVLRSSPEIHARQIKALVDRPDAAAYLPGIQVQTLLVVGAKDQWSPVAQHEEMLGLLPDAKLTIIRDAGHFAPLERPEQVAKLLADFLRN